jgi:hypothetical protein
LRNILADPGISAEYRGRATVFQRPCEDVLTTEIAAMPKFDMVLTSPPYFNLELYTAGEQSTLRYPTWNEWVTGWLKPVILGSLDALREGGVSCWSVKNFKTDKQYNLRDVVIEVHKETGWGLTKTIEIDGPSRMGTGRINKDGKASRKSKEETYCFMKGLPAPSSVSAPSPAPSPSPSPSPEPTPVQSVIKEAYSKLKRPELQALCRDKNIKGYSKMTKEQLITVLLAAETTIEHV